MKKVILSVMFLFGVILFSCQKTELVPNNKIDIVISKGYNGNLPDNFNVIGYSSNEDTKGVKPLVFHRWGWIFLSCDGCGQCGGATEWHCDGTPPRCPYCGRDEQSSPPAYFGWADVCDR